MTLSKMDDIKDGRYSDDIKNGPLGYQHFLCDVNFEFSPGGNRPISNENKYCFKMKCLPYMIGRNLSEIKAQKLDDIIDCDQKIENYESSDTTQTHIYGGSHIDVTRATCAFLGNNEYVPNRKSKRRQVVLELISAKLSQSTYYVAPNSTYTNLITLNENSLQPSFINCCPSPTNHQASKEPNPSNDSISTPPSSKKFVNYTILIKTVPGLDKYPAVIERRFSDFLNLYQGLKSHKLYANIVDDYVNFPKKVYMGNFSIAKIAERSIEFSRLLSLCMSKTSLLWSVPFISFLVDKELKDAHRLSLFGDPDDVQAILETAFFIEQKLYIDTIQAPSNGNSSNTSDLSDSPNNRYSPLFSNGRSILIQASSNETISVDSSQSSVLRTFSADRASSSSNQSICDSNDDLDSFLGDRTSLSSLIQRILVTLCMLMVVYCRGKNYRELKQAVQQLKRLISSQDVVESLINTHHYASLRACLLFLMNLNRTDVIDEETRIWLKRRLEDVDAAHAEIESIDMTQTTTDNHYAPDNRNRNRKYYNDKSNRGTNHVSKNDLTSLLRDKKFCSFQDSKHIQS